MSQVEVEHAQASPARRRRLPRLAIVLKGKPRFCGFEIERTAPAMAEWKGTVVDWQRIGASEVGRFPVLDADGRPLLVEGRPVRLETVGHSSHVVPCAYRARAIRNALRSRMLDFAQDSGTIGVIALIERLYTELFAGAIATAAVGVCVVLVIRWQQFGSGMLPVLMLTALLGVVLYAGPYLVLRKTFGIKPKHRIRRVHVTTAGMDGQRMNGECFSFRWHDVRVTRAPMIGLVIEPSEAPKLFVRHDSPLYATMRTLGECRNGDTLRALRYRRYRRARALAVGAIAVTLIGTVVVTRVGRMGLIPNPVLAPIAFLALGLSFSSLPVLVGSRTIGRKLRQLKRRFLRRAPVEPPPTIPP